MGPFLDARVDNCAEDGCMRLSRTIPLFVFMRQRGRDSRAIGALIAHLPILSCFARPTLERINDAQGAIRSEA